MGSLAGVPGLIWAIGNARHRLVAGYRDMDRGWQEARWDGDKAEYNEGGRGIVKLFLNESITSGIS